MNGLKGDSTRNPIHLLNNVIEDAKLITKNYGYSFKILVKSRIWIITIITKKCELMILQLHHPTGTSLGNNEKTVSLGIWISLKTRKD